MTTDRKCLHKCSHSFSTYRTRYATRSYLSADQKSSQQSVEPADIVAEDQGGQEFDPASNNADFQEPASSEKGSPKDNTAEINDEAEKDQGGREFEPLPVKRILVD